MKRWISSVCVVGIFFSSGVFALARHIAPSQIPLDNFSVEQLQQAAEAGDPDAQYALGYMHYYGKRVSQNTQLAINWMKRASVQGQEQASRALSLLGQKQTQEQEPQVETVGAKNTQKLAAAKKTKEQKSTSKAQSGGYTIQLLSSSNKQKIENYIKQNNLQGKATYAQNKNKGKLSYTLTYGNYKTRAEAQAAIAKLPEKVRSQKPWVKANPL